MKAFTIVYAKTICEDTVIEAKNEKEAVKKFRAMQPDVRVLDVQTWYEFSDF